MALKVKILSILLFICLIDSLHSASYRREKRDGESEQTTVGEESQEKSTKAPETTQSSGPSSPPEGSQKPSPVDISKVLEKFTSWIHDAGSWFPNPTSWLNRGGP